MKKRDGFTLVELLVVMVIFTMISALGVPAYSSWKRKHDVQDQISTLYNDLQAARIQSYSEKVACGLWWGGGAGFTSYELRRDSNNDNDIDDSGTDQVDNSKTAKFTVTSSNAARASVDFDGRGFCWSPISFSIAPGYGAAQDCVSVSRTRIKMGKMNGANCVPR